MKEIPPTKKKNTKNKNPFVPEISTHLGQTFHLTQKLVPTRSRKKFPPTQKERSCVKIKRDFEAFI